MRPTKVGADDRSVYQLAGLAHRRDSPFHTQARQTLVSLAEGRATWSSALVLLAEDRHHWPQLPDLILRASLQGPMVHDARVAALCLVHGVRELWSADRDFSRFPDLRVRNPLVRNSPA